jgi:hypothetical protein
MKQLKQDDVETISDDEGDPFIGLSTEAGVNGVQAASDPQGEARPATLQEHVAASTRRKERGRTATWEAKGMAAKVNSSLVGGVGLTGG